MGRECLHLFCLELSDMLRRDMDKLLSGLGQTALSWRVRQVLVITAVPQKNENNIAEIFSTISN
jgi:hypothetical protein